MSSQLEESRPHMRIVVAVLCALCMRVAMAEEPQSAPAMSIPMPRSKLPPEDYYPAAAKRAGKEGRVLLEFRIAASGKAEEVMVLQADEGELFSAKAIQLVQGAKFAVDKDAWEKSGNATHRFRFGVTFELMPCGKLPRFEPVDSSVEVCGSPIHH